MELPAQLSLRDYFAGQALQKLVRVRGTETQQQMFDAVYDAVAREAYRHADAMLALRGKGY